MSLDLVAVQRDATLLDALSQRAGLDDIDSRRAADPVVGLLAALVADVDAGLQAGAAKPAAIPEQRRRHSRTATVLTLAVPAAPRRRHAARAVAALVVAAVVLSVGGVAAAVSGDPLTPYRNVVNVVRGEYRHVMPSHGLVAPRPNAKAAAHRTKVAAKASRPAVDARQDVATRASRTAWRGTDGRRLWDRAGWSHKAAARHGWNRGGSDGRSGGNRPAGHRSDGRSSGRGDRDHLWGGSGERAGWHDGAGSGAGRDASDTGEHGDRSGDGRR